MQHHAGRARVVGRHFNGTPRRRANAHLEGLEYRFLRRESRGESLGARASVALFAGGKESLDETGMALERQSKARDVDEVDANAPRTHYSTVTVLARLRGRSILRPSPFATEYAKSCKGITSTMGENIGSVAGTRNT